MKHLSQKNNEDPEGEERGEGEGKDKMEEDKKDPLYGLVQIAEEMRELCKDLTTEKNEKVTNFSPRDLRHHFQDLIGLLAKSFEVSDTDLERKHQVLEAHNFYLRNDKRFDNGIPTPNIPKTNTLSPQIQDDVEDLMDICLETAEDTKVKVQDWVACLAGPTNHSVSHCTTNAIKSLELLCINLLVLGTLATHGIGILGKNNKTNEDKIRTKRSEELLKNLESWEKEYFDPEGLLEILQESEASGSPRSFELESLANNLEEKEVNRAIKRLREMFKNHAKMLSKFWDKAQPLIISLVETPEDAEILCPETDLDRLDLVKQETAKIYGSYGIKIQFQPLEQKDVFLWLAKTKKPLSSESLSDYTNFLLSEQITAMRTHKKNTKSQKKGLKIRHPEL